MQRLVLWGHHLDEYQDMFALSQEDLTGCLLEYGCGASAVNSELQDMAAKIVSYDPWFDLDQTAIEHMVAESFKLRLAQIKHEQEKLNLQRYGHLEALVAYRQKGMHAFFKDYGRGCEEQRYHALTDVELNLPDFAFDYALSAHFLFHGESSADVNYHVRVIAELARVAKEVRIFPLIDRKGTPSPLLGPVLLELQRTNYGVEVREVPYYLQLKGNAMLRVWAQECKLPGE